MFTLRVGEEYTELSALLLIRATAEYQMPVNCLTVPIVTVGAIPTLVFRCFLYLPLPTVGVSRSHSRLLRMVKHVAHALLRDFFERLIHIVAVSELLYTLTL